MTAKDILETSASPIIDGIDLPWGDLPDNRNVPVVVDFDRNTYENVCFEMRDLLQRKKELKAQEEVIRARVIALAGGDRMEYGVKVTMRQKTGAVDWKAMVEDLGIDGLTVEKYRKAGSEYWEVKNY